MSDPQKEANHELEMQVGDNAGAAIKNFAEKILEHDENIVRERDEIKALLASAKSEGFDVAAIRKVVAASKKDQAERIERETIERLYMVAAGLQVAT